MAQKKSKRKQSGDQWQIAKNKYKLAVRHIKMAKALGLNPKKLGSYANHQQEPWKSPLRDYIEELYEERFGPYVDENQPDKIHGSTPQLCKKDGFPVVSINGKRECIAEYIDRCIGGQTIADVVKRGSVPYYQFENGHELPLLCYCCGKPYVINDLENHKEEMVGLHLHEMGHSTVTFGREATEPEDGKTGSTKPVSNESEESREVIDFELFFQPPIGISKRAMKQSFWFEVAKSMQHPSSCKHSRKRRPLLR